MTITHGGHVGSSSLTLQVHGECKGIFIPSKMSHYMASVNYVETGFEALCEHCKCLYIHL